MSIGEYSSRLIPHLLLHRNETPSEWKGRQQGERQRTAIFHWAKDLSSTLRGLTLLMLINPENEMRLTALSGSETAISGVVWFWSADRRDSWVFEIVTKSEKTCEARNPWFVKEEVTCILQKDWQHPIKRCGYRSPSFIWEILAASYLLL